MLWTPTSDVCAARCSCRALLTPVSAQAAMLLDSAELRAGRGLGDSQPDQADPNQSSCRWQAAHCYQRKHHPVTGEQRRGNAAVYQSLFQAVLQINFHAYLHVPQCVCLICKVSLARAQCPVLMCFVMQSMHASSTVAPKGKGYAKLQIGSVILAHRCLVSELHFALYMQ